MKEISKDLKSKITEGLGKLPEDKLIEVVDFIDFLSLKESKKDSLSEKEESIKINPWDEIAKIAKPVGRSDLSVRYHEVLGDLVE